PISHSSFVLFYHYLLMYSFYFLYLFFLFFFFNDTATTEIYTLSLHDALPISERHLEEEAVELGLGEREGAFVLERVLRGEHEERSEEHTSELQSRENLVCRLLLEKKKKKKKHQIQAIKIKEKKVDKLSTHLKK